VGARPAGSDEFGADEASESLAETAGDSEGVGCETADEIEKLVEWF
jgi:hypothetical protein